MNSSKTIYTFTIAALAAQFARQLRETLTLEQMQEVLRRNAADDTLACGTHDFCDANQVMCYAFEELANREIYLPSDVDEAVCTQEQVDADLALTEEAWRFARHAGFDPEAVAQLDLAARDAAALLEAVSAALDAGCAVIQRHLNVTTGDFAGIYFSGPQDGLTALLRAYLAAQRAAMARD